MKNWILIVLTLSVFQLAVADFERFISGDYLFVKAQVIGCGSQLRFVETGQVTDSGQVTLFNDIQLEVDGKTTSEVATQLVDALEQRTGHRSKTIKIIRVPVEDSKKAASWMMRVHAERSQNCELKNHPQDFPDWLGEFQIAHASPHNKSFKYIPALRASTGRGSAAPLN